MNKKLIIKIVSLLIATLILFGFIWAWSVTRVVRKNSKNNALQNQHAIIQNIIVTETQDEKKYWEFYAKSGEYNSEHNSVLLNDVIGNFYDKNQEVVVSFKTNKGTYDELTKKVILNGDNVFVGKDGSRLHADELIWQGQDKDILANGNVQFIQIGKIVAKADKAI
ncbi:MAG: LPS export ABC transporter periplasmic protein LptC, partial [Candidatus Gastranaerophilales bacterium]|nr:LPS export ABC transporter periplasmic protein LptC [Candidatus Gastranaerophilales bacterium]